LSCTAIIGLQWGDEGKGKIVDVLSKDADIVARYQGGPNAGHTVVIDDTSFVLHLVPTGILRPGKTCLVGNGVVIDPEGFLGELEELQKRGVETSGRVFVSSRAQVIMPYHQAVEHFEEGHRVGGPIGTTGRGIGPAYCDKASRRGVRIADLYDPPLLAEKVENALAHYRALVGDFDALTGVDPAGWIVEEALRWGEKLAPMVADTSALANEAIDAGKKVLLEGAQGILLDIDHGTYPYVTSSSSGVGGASSGLGIPPGKIDSVVGVAKAYSTRVGNGPFPSESTGAERDVLRKVGREYGSTTGRPRRCGWFDAVAVRYAARLSGLSSMVVTKVDVLDGLEKIGICVAYRHGGKRYDTLPASFSVLKECSAEIEYVDGWKEDTSRVRSSSELPGKARAYLKRIEELSGVPVSMVSVGQDREQTFLI